MSLTSFISASLFLLMGACFFPGDQGSSAISAEYSERRFTPSWSSEKWSAPGSISFNGEKEKSENKLFVFARWNRDSLSFYFKVHDNDLRSYQQEQDHAQLFLDDMVEVLIDTKNKKDTCWSADDIVYHINLLGVKKDDRGTAGCTSDAGWNGKALYNIKLLGTLNDTTDQDTGYMVFLHFPWSELGQTPRKHLTMGVNLANGDNDGKGRELFDWAGAWPLRSPDAFNSIVLK